MNKANTKISVILTLSIIAILISVFAFARPDTTRQPFEVSPSGGQTAVVIPSHAKEVAPGVFSLGTATDVDGRAVQGFMFVHDNRRENAKPPWAGGGKGGGEKCFALFAKGAGWKETEQYITDDGSYGTKVDAALTETSLETWDSEVSFNIFGAGTSSGVVDGADGVRPDNKNEVMFEDLGATSTIAYTIVWGIFSGPPSGRELVEWDAVFNSNYDWSLSGESGKMDYQNIATHEFGHALGLGHPGDSCTEETMYRFASAGETKKRDLNAGDIAGINKLYS